MLPGKQNNGLLEEWEEKREIKAPEMGEAEWSRRRTFTI